MGFEALGAGQCSDRGRQLNERFTAEFLHGNDFHKVGGGETAAIRCVGFQTTVARGGEWAATGKVTLPIPDGFPQDKVSTSLDK